MKKALLLLGMFSLSFWVLGDCYNEWVDAAMLLNEADSLNDVGSYAEAQFVYKQVVEYFPETVSAETALKSLFSLEAQLEGDYLSLKEYYLSNNTIAADETLLHLASSLANKCDEKLGNYAEAIGWYENVLANPETSFNDSIFASIDLGDLYMRIGTIGEKAVGKLLQYKPESDAIHRKQTDYALSLLPKEKDEKPIYYDLPSISNLEISVGHNDTVSLSWNLPNNVDEAVLTMSNMQVWDYIGTAAGQCASDISQLFLSSLLRPFVGWSIKDVSVIFCPDDTLGGYQPDYPNYYIRVWKGGDNPLLVCDQYVNHPIYGSVQTIPLDTNVIIDEDVNLRIGYFTDRYRSYTWACDFRSMPQEGNGCLSLQLYHNDNNELHECFPDNRWYDQYVLPNNLCVAATLINPNENGTQGRTLTGYRVYRDGEIIKEIPYTVVTHFTDTEFMKGFDVEYCVTAVYGEEESEPVCATATITGVVEEHENDGVTVLPNPTNGIVHIGGTTTAEVRVYNAIGQLLKTVRNANEINLKGLAQGVYMLHITDENGAVATRKLVLE